MNCISVGEFYIIQIWLLLIKIETLSRVIMKTHTYTIQLSISYPIL